MAGDVGRMLIEDDHSRDVALGARAAAAAGSRGAAVDPASVPAAAVKGVPCC
jgi:hypothetical protein